MKPKPNNLKKLHTLKKAEKKQHQQEVATIVNETQHNYKLKFYQYNNIKKLKWYDYFYIIAISSLVIGCSFCFSIFGFKNIKKTQWIIVGFLAITIIVWLLIGWYKNKNAASYFNDARKRYHTTLTPQEALLKKNKKYLILIGLLLALSSVIVWILTS